MTSIKILVVDDHPIFRAGAVNLLSSIEGFEVIGEVDCASAALDIVRESRPQLVLTDIRLKGDTNGVALAKQLREDYPEIKIVILTNYSHEPYVRAMMEARVDGYLLKDVPPSEVIDSVRMVVEGRSVFSAPITRKVVTGYLGGTGIERSVHPEQLTERELEVLRLLAGVHPNREIAENLHVTVATVQYHLSNIYAKFGVKTRAEAVIRAAHDGLVIIDE